jgi:cytoskeleton protein RodZ
MSNEEMNEPIAADEERQQGVQVTRTPGAQLAAYREEQGWSIEQVATQLNLAPRQIQAIENDDYRALPGMAIVRGFIRAYAKLLKVDPAPLIAALPGEAVVTNEPPASRRMRATPFSEPRFPSITDQPGLSGKYIAGAVVVALAALGVWALQQTGDLAGLSGSLSMQVEKHWANVSGSTADASKPAPLNTEAASPVPVLETVRPATPGAEPAAAVAAPSASAAAPAAAPAANAAQEAAAGKDSLVLKVREDSWIEVKRPDNRIVIARLAKAGTTETVEVNGPLSVVIGNASGVDVALRGNPLELKASTSSNVARLSVK